MNAEIRAEIIANQSVQYDITEFLEEMLPDIQYTLIPEIHGKGHKTSKLGDNVWPEQNFLLFSYVSRAEAAVIKECVAQVVKKFPNEGITLFFTQAVEI